MKYDNRLDRKGIGKLFTTLLILSTLLAACSNSEPSANEEGAVIKTINENFSIATPQPGIFFHSMGSAIASVVNENSELNVTIRPFAGAQTWAPLLNKGQVDFGIETGENLPWAMEGYRDYEESKNIRTFIHSGYIPLAGFAVREDSGINSISDLKGKRIASDYAGDWSVSLDLESQLRTVGLTWDDVKRAPVSDIGAGIEALRDGRVDAALAGNPEVGLFLEADEAIGIKALNYGDVKPKEFDQFPQELKDMIFENVPGTEPTVFKGGFVEEDTVIVRKPVTMYVGAHVSDEAVYKMMETVWENYDAMATMFGWLENWTPDTIFNEEPLGPYHQGVVQFFKDKGLWTEKAEAHQSELLESLK